MRSTKNFVYRSKDEGKTWEKQNWKMEKASAEEDGAHLCQRRTPRPFALPTRAHRCAPGRASGKSGILSLHVSPVDSTKIFFRGAGKQHWVTFDQGDHYMPLDTSFTIKELKMHPTESGARARTCLSQRVAPSAPCTRRSVPSSPAAQRPSDAAQIACRPACADWMMASHLSDGCHKPGERVNCSMEVYLSTDFGKAWRPVTSYVAQFDWAPAVDGVLKPGMQKESMFLVTYEKKEGARARAHATPLAAPERSETPRTPASP